jgi:hypothetical protein
MPAARMRARPPGGAQRAPRRLAGASRPLACARVASRRFKGWGGRASRGPCRAAAAPERPRHPMPPCQAACRSGGAASNDPCRRCGRSLAARPAAAGTAGRRGAHRAARRRRARPLPAPPPAAAALPSRPPPPAWQFLVPSTTHKPSITPSPTPFTRIQPAQPARPPHRRIGGAHRSIACTAPPGRDRAPRGRRGDQLSRARDPGRPPPALEGPRPPADRSGRDLPSGAPCGRPRAAPSAGGSRARACARARRRRRRRSRCTGRAPRLPATAPVFSSPPPLPTRATQRHPRRCPAPPARALSAGARAQPPPPRVRLQQQHPQQRWWRSQRSR